MFDPHQPINNINTAASLNQSISIPSYHHQLQHCAQQPPGSLTQRRYRLVRQQSQGWEPAGPTQSLLQPAYSSPHINQYANTNMDTTTDNNIYAEVENDYEIDSGFTEDSSGDTVTNSTNSSGGASFCPHDHNQVGCYLQHFLIPFP